VRLPQGRVLSSEVLAVFAAERSRIDALLGIEQPPAKQVAALN
jgi:hypothetical protein